MLARRERPGLMNKDVIILERDADTHPESGYKSEKSNFPVLTLLWAGLGRTGGWIVIVAIFLWPSLSLSLSLSPSLSLGIFSAWQLQSASGPLLSLYKVIPDPRAGYEALLWSIPRLRLMSGPAFIMWQRLEFHPFLNRPVYQEDRVASSLQTLHPWLIWPLNDRR